MTDPTLNLERARARAQLNLERRPTAAWAQLNLERRPSAAPGHRIVRLNMRGEIMAETHTEDVDPQPTWSEYEHFSVIAPNDVSAAYDGSCWAIDWGRNRVVKIAPDGTMVAFTEPCEVPDPDQCLGELIHPLAIDCAGDPDSCFVADYEGNRVYKLTLNGGSIALQVSSAQYYRPKAIAVWRDSMMLMIRFDRNKFG